MVICDRLRALREEKKLSQGDIEKRTGLLRCYISRAENGHTVPTVETLEKMAQALEVSLYRLFYDGEAPPKLENLPKRKTAHDIAWVPLSRPLALQTTDATASASVSRMRFDVLLRRSSRCIISCATSCARVENSSAGDWPLSDGNAIAHGVEQVLP